MTLTIVSKSPAVSPVVTETSISLADVAPWDRYHVAFSPEESVARLWSVFGIDATRDQIFSGGAREPDLENPSDRTAVSWLRRMATDSDRGLRERLFPSAATLAEISGLAEIAPNFAGVLQVVRTAVAAALHTTTPLRLPPLLLLGAPGIGKSFIANRLAKALGTTITRVDFAGATDLSPLGGSHRVWRGADVGCVARAMISSKCASPIFLLDEVDKASRLSDGADPTAVLHSLLEVDQARHFRDECLETHFRADECLWVATANEITSMPRTILDRFLIIDVAPPSADQMRIIVRTLFVEIAGGRFPGWFTDPVSDDVVDRIRSVHPRRARRIIDLACQTAAAAQRTTVTTWDVATAERLLGGTRG